MPVTKVLPPPEQPSLDMQRDKLRQRSTELMTLFHAVECLRTLGKDAEFETWQQPIEDAIGPVEMVESILLDNLIQAIGRDELQRIILDHYTNW